MRCDHGRISLLLGILSEIMIDLLDSTLPLISSEYQSEMLMLSMQSARSEPHPAECFVQVSASCASTSIDLISMCCSIRTIHVFTPRCNLLGYESFDLLLHNSVNTNFREY